MWSFVSCNQIIDIKTIYTHIFVEIYKHFTEDLYTNLYKIFKNQTKNAQLMTELLQQLFENNKNQDVILVLDNIDVFDNNIKEGLFSLMNSLCHLFSTLGVIFISNKPVESYFSKNFIFTPLEFYNPPYIDEEINSMFESFINDINIPLNENQILETSHFVISMILPITRNVETILLIVI